MFLWKLWRMSELVCGPTIRRAPLVVVVGATGLGKTKLGIELSKAFPAEIVSADSMQVYKGLDVVTAKPTAEERAAAPHHLVDIIEPHLSFSVVDFRNRALTIIDKLMSEGKVPVVVGGTNYYVESVLWHTLIEAQLQHGQADAQLVCERDPASRKRKLSDAEPDRPEPGDSEERVRLRELLAAERAGGCVLTSAELHERLRTVDPATANRLHPNDRRKICRALEVWAHTGRKQSEVLAEQADTERQLRYKDRTIMLWLRCDQAEHDKRLDARVDQMVTAGLVQEMLDYHAKYNAARLADNLEADYTKGIFQTLGFKEFHDYLVLSAAERDSLAGRALLARGLDDMKRCTRRFAHRQDNMVRTRFLEHPTREIPLIYELDTTDLSAWESEVRDKAVSIVAHHIRGTACPHPAAQPSPAARTKTDADIHAHHRCVPCDRVIIGDIQFNLHLASNKHRRQLDALRRLERGGKRARLAPAHASPDAAPPAPPAHPVPPGDAGEFAWRGRGRGRARGPAPAHASPDAAPPAPPTYPVPPGDAGEFAWRGRGRGRARGHAWRGGPGAGAWRGGSGTGACCCGHRAGHAGRGLRGARGWRGLRGLRGAHPRRRPRDVAPMPLSCLWGCVLVKGASV